MSQCSSFSDAISHCVKHFHTLRTLHQSVPLPIPDVVEKEVVTRPKWNAASKRSRSKMERGTPPQQLRTDNIGKGVGLVLYPVTYQAELKTHSLCDRFTHCFAEAFDVEKWIVTVDSQKTCCDTTVVAWALAVDQQNTFSLAIMEKLRTTPQVFSRVVTISESSLWSPWPSWVVGDPTGGVNDSVPTTSCTSIECQTISVKKPSVKETSVGTVDNILPQHHEHQHHREHHPVILACYRCQSPVLGALRTKDVLLSQFGPYMDLICGGPCGVDDVWVTVVENSDRLPGIHGFVNHHQGGGEMYVPKGLNRLNDDFVSGTSWDMVAKMLWCRGCATLPNPSTMKISSSPIALSVGAGRHFPDTGCIVFVKSPLAPLPERQRQEIRQVDKECKNGNIPHEHPGGQPPPPLHPINPPKTDRNNECSAIAPRPTTASTTSNNATTSSGGRWTPVPPQRNSSTTASGGYTPHPATPRRTLLVQHNPSPAPKELFPPAHSRSPLQCHQQVLLPQHHHNHHNPHNGFSPALAFTKASNSNVQDDF